MISHVYIGVVDFQRALEFYREVLGELGLTLKFEEHDVPWAGWMKRDQPRPLLIVGRAFDGQPATPGNGQMVALLAPDRTTVDRCYRLALVKGAASEGEPGLRPHYHPNYYGAYFRDPDGNKVGLCCHDTE